MREITHIAIHCTATSQDTTLQNILNFWQKVKLWKNPGYHTVFLPNGEIEELLSFKLISNGVIGYNSSTINLAYIGGVDENNKPIDNRTEAQKRVMKHYIKSLQLMFPKAIIQGHRDFQDVNKACPSFDVSEWLKSF